MLRTCCAIKVVDDIKLIQAGFNMSWASHSFLPAAIALSALTITTRAEGGGAKTAQGAPSAAYEKCLDSGDARMGVMPAIWHCDQDELKRQDKALNDIYRTVRNNLVPAKRPQLQALERRWIAQRDKKCKAELDGSQDGRLLWDGCLIEETERRIKWLKEFAPKT